VQKLFLFACGAGLVISLTGCHKKEDPLSLVTPKGWSQPTSITHTTWEQDEQAKLATEAAAPVEPPNESFTSRMVHKAQSLIAKVLPKKRHPLAKARNNRRIRKGVLVHHRQKKSAILATTKNH
jgi:hypothetical protein